MIEKQSEGSHLVWLVLLVLCLATWTRGSDAQTVTTLHSFGWSDGAKPYAGLIQANDGNLYGTTWGGGAYAAYGGGTVFKMDSTGNNYSVLYSFGATNYYESSPVTALVQGSDGLFYGTTLNGGSANGGGTVFRIDSAGNVT